MSAIITYINESLDRIITLNNLPNHCRFYTSKAAQKWRLAAKTDTY